MIKKGLLFTAIISLVLLASCESSSKEKLEKQKVKLEGEITEKQTELDEVKQKLAELDTTKEAISLPKVDVMLAKVQLFEHFFETQGNLEAEKMSVLTPENGGKIISINVKEGDQVSAGTTIAVFDQSVIASNIKELDKNLELAKYMYEKQQNLYNQGVGTEVQLKQAKTQYEALKQTKASLSTQAGKFVLKAPYSGYIEEVFVVEGEVAGPMNPIVRIINTSKLKVTADISEVYIKNLTTKTSVDVVFPAIQDTLKNIKLTRLGKFINPNNRTINVEVDVPSKDEYIPNLMSVIKVRDFVDTAALVISNNAILEDNKGSTFVFLINADNTAEKRIVSVGKSYNGLSTILSGLKPNDSVVVNGARKLVNGQEIEIENKL